jgi:hypothetical protein
MNLWLHKMLENYRVAAQLVASQVVLSSTELVIGRLFYFTNDLGLFMLDS